MWNWRAGWGVLPRCRRTRMDQWLRERACRDGTSGGAAAICIGWAQSVTQLQSGKAKSRDELADVAGIWANAETNIQ